MTEPARDEQPGASPLVAPFPWFGGKRKVGAIVWARLGDVQHYIEPFFGSGAMLLARPATAGSKTETVNDIDGFVANFWRAVAHDPDAVARWADWPVNENDLHARHAWLVERRDELVSRLEGDPAFCDSQLAGWWLWGICAWLGGGWCSGRGPWRAVDGQLVHIESSDTPGISRRRIQLGWGQGIHAARLHAPGEPAPPGVPAPAQTEVLAWLRRLSARMRHVRVCSGDWSRVCTHGVLEGASSGAIGVFLDPPYSASAGRTDRIYAADDLQVAARVREWAIAHGDHARLRIALCGYEGEHDMPASWSCVAWSGPNGLAYRNTENRHRERIWFSPRCHEPETGQLELALEPATAAIARGGACER